MAPVSINDRLAAIKQLPTLPLVVRQVQKIIKNPKTNMEQIASVIAKDQVLAARVIRLVNSAFYALPKRVSAVSQAILVLGLNTVNNLLMSVSIVNLFKVDGVTDFNHESFWEHAFGCALIARGIAKRIGYLEPEDCFTAGLIHDIGRLVLEQYFHAEFMTALRRSHERSTTLRDEELGVFGASHEEVGAILADRWNLPGQIIAVIKYHHTPSDRAGMDPRHASIVAIVAHANQLIQSAGIGASGEHASITPVALEGHTISPEDIEAIIAKAREEVSEAMRGFRQ
jgi:putative nucleotidyltransferase with HDIG domain